MSRNTTTDALSHRLHSADPASLITHEELAASRARTLAWMAAAPETNTPPVEVTQLARHPQALRRKKIVRRSVLPAAAAAVLTGAFLATDIATFLWRAPATAEAVEVLNSAALQSSGHADPAPRAGQFLKIDTKVVMVEEGRTASKTLYWLRSQDRQLYVPGDPNNMPVLNLEPVLPVGYFGDATEASVGNLLSRIPRGRNEGGDLTHASLPWSANELDSLPRDPKQLLQRIHEQNGNLTGEDADTQAVVWISDRLRSGVLSADLRAALYRTVTLIPGVFLAEHQANLDGMTGTAIGRVDPRTNSRHELIIDPGTGRFIGERIVDLDGYGAVPAGTATTWSAVRTSIVDTAPKPAR